MHLHFFRVENLESIFKQVDLAIIICWSISCHGRRCVDFNQPWLQLVVKKDIVAVELEAVFVVDDGLGDGLERTYD